MSTELLIHPTSMTFESLDQHRMVVIAEDGSKIGSAIPLRNDSFDFSLDNSPVADELRSRPNDFRCIANFDDNSITLNRR